MMNRKEIREIIREDKKQYSKYLLNSKKNNIYFRIISDHVVYMLKYQILMRWSQYYANRPGLIAKIIFLYYEKRKNHLGNRLGLYLHGESFGPGLIMYHHGEIIVNSQSRIGANCKLHGCNCIGNNGDEKNQAPIIGDNVEIGFGASIIGPVKIANNVKIGAGAVVTRSCHTEGATLVGIPAKEKP